jgi:methylated-DNA-[protein]-cysteine S-methyltransferase
MRKRTTKSVKYTIFKTKWGYFGLAGTEYGLLRTHLPVRESNVVKSRILKNLPIAQYDKNLFKTLQEQIIAYFEGSYINFSPDIPIVLDGFSNFAKAVLRACRDITFGRTISYSRLAEKTGRAGTGRAVGGVLARNPLPLIIPCHRVICDDGQLGGFSASGGVKLKEKLLKLEGKAAFPTPS